MFTNSIEQTLAAAKPCYWNFTVAVRVSSLKERNSFFGDTLIYLHQFRREFLGLLDSFLTTIVQKKSNLAIECAFVAAVDPVSGCSNHCGRRCWITNIAVGERFPPCNSRIVFGKFDDFFMTAEALK